MSSYRSKNLFRTVFSSHPILLVILIAIQGCISTPSDSAVPPEVRDNNGTQYASCRLRPSTTLPPGLPKAYGHVLFKQEYPRGKLQVILNLHGFLDESKSEPRAVHIHQYGDCSQGCDSTGGHFNPFKVPHPSHPGDFGNFEASQGRIHEMFESGGTLFGELSVLGRAVVIHENADDLGQGSNAGSLIHGNAGRRLGCCVIGITSPKVWDTFQQRYRRRG